jgi:hypothetical protein
MTVRTPNDTFVERMVIKYKGREFQIHRHDKRDDFILLFLESGRIEITNMEMLDMLIELNCI